MYQIDNSSVAPVIPASTTPGTPGYFTDGNPATGTTPTIVPAEFLNMMMMEIINVLTAAGITPSKSNFTQLLAAIKSVNRQGVILSDTGAANAYAAANTPALTALPATGYSQRVNIAHANTGASTYAPDGLSAKPVYGLGLQPLQGGELPVGIAVLMYLVQAGVNGGNGAWVIIESLGGASQVAPATQSQHAMQLGQATGLVGAASNVAMTVAVASASGTLTADQIIVGTTLNGLQYSLVNFNKTINLATVGAGGMDVGTAPVSGYVALYAIYNPTTQVSALLAVNATSVKAPSVYGGANMPAGYTASALVGVWPTSASSQFVAGKMLDRSFHSLSGLGLSVVSRSTNQTTALAVSLAVAVPINAKSCCGILNGSSSVATTIATAVWSDIATSGAGDGQQATVGGATQIICPFRDLILGAPQQMYYTVQALAGTPSFVINITKYTF